MADERAGSAWYDLGARDDRLREALRNAPDRHDPVDDVERVAGCRQ